MVVSVEDIDLSKKNQVMLEIKNDELDTLLYRASHDLKSPVTTLVGLCHLLRLEQTNLESSELFRHLEATVDRLKNQNEALLQLTKIQDWELVSQRILLSKLVEGLLLELPVGQANIRLSDLEIELTTDGRLLAMALKHILENALLYVQPGMAPEIIVDYVRILGLHKITVADRGTGIPVKELDGIMTMFFRGSIHSRGSGMGLYIAKKAIEKLRGEIAVTSQEGEGSSFSLFLPTK